MNDISINVYCIEKKKDAEFSILPIRLANGKKDKHVNLLYVQDPRDDNAGHFAWIKNLSRLVSSQLSKKKNRKFFCDRYVYLLKKYFITFSKNKKLWGFFLQMFTLLQYERKVGGSRCRLQRDE